MGAEFFSIMPRGQLTKDEIKYLILQQKNKLIKESYFSSDPKAVASKHLNELLDKIEEYRF